MPAIDTSDTKQQRNFGLLLAAALCLLGLVRWWRTDTCPAGLLGTGGAFLFLALALPAVLRPLLVVWLALARALNWTTTRLLLTVVFFGMIMPGRAILWVVGYDPLKRRWAPETDTYWEQAEEQPAEWDRYRNQF